MIRLPVDASSPITSQSLTEPSGFGLSHRVVFSSDTTASTEPGQAVGATPSEPANQVIDLTVEAPSNAASSTRGQFWRVVGSTFITIFIAELGDKTQLSTLLMAAEFHAPWTVFAGAGAALVATSFLGVWVGHWLAQRLSPKTLDTAAGVLMALLSLGLFWDAWHS